MLPAIVLLANETSAFWQNLATTGEYALDIVTTLSGVGNILKFRHLAKLSTLQQLITIGGYVEVTSGTVSALLKLTQADNAPWAKDLQEVLFYLELLALGAEVTNVIRNRLKQSAENVLKYEDEIDDLFLTRDEFQEFQEYRFVIKTLKELSKQAIKTESKLLYRVQGGNTKPNISKFRFKIDNKGKLFVIGEEMLHITFDDVNRTIEFFIKRGNNAEVYVADINQKFVQKIRDEAVAQNVAKAFPKRPQIDDPNQTQGSFGLPKEYFTDLLNNITNPRIVKNK